MRGFLSAVFLRLAVSLLSDHVAAQQDRGVQYPAALPSASNEGVDFMSLFGASSIMPGTEAWAPQDWNGLTTFAKTTPLRCFGVDADIPYDVAILGRMMCSLYVSCNANISYSMARCPVRYGHELQARVNISPKHAHMGWLILF